MHECCSERDYARNGIITLIQAIHPMLCRSRNRTEFAGLEACDGAELTNSSLSEPIKDKIS
jgi:hypothetical protein